MFDKKAKILSAAMVLSVTPAAYAEVFVVNTATIETPQAASQPYFSLSNLDAGKIKLLQSYGYAERAAASNKRRQSLMLLSAQLAGWKKSGAPDQDSVNNIRKSLAGMDAEIRESLGTLGNLDVPELQRLYENEQKNAQAVRALQQQAEKIKVAGGGAVPAKIAPAGTAGRYVPDEKTDTAK